MTQQVGRYCDIHNIPEVKALKKGMDFRLPQYRREVFLRFHQYHLQYNSHPGAVYFAMPWLAKYKEMDLEHRLWMAFINGCSQNIVTTDIIMSEFPTLETTDVNSLDDWWNYNHHHFIAGSGWDSDRKYFKLGKVGFPQCVASYKLALQGKTQEEFFLDLCTTGNPHQDFSNVWAGVRSNFLSFGRLSTFSYLEYLRIVGIPIDCNSLFLDDIAGSKSHRNGLCKVLGRDDLDDYEATNPDFPGYEKTTLEWLQGEGQTLLREARGRIDHKDVSYFTLESTFCNYKSWHRPNRRYPGTYNDMMAKRIQYAEREWPKCSFDHFWQMRQDCLPEYLRIEDNPGDPTNHQEALSKEKQNHYRLTGQPVMMDQEWECFENDFNTKYYHTKVGLDQLWD